MLSLTTAKNVASISTAYTVASIGVQFATGNFVGGAYQIAEEIVYSKLGAFKPIAKQSEKLVKLLGGIWGRGVKLRLDNPSSNSGDLRHNMEQLLGKAPNNHQAHHIVAGNSAEAKVAQDILKKHNININSPQNGVFLPDCSFRPSKGGPGAVSSIHCGGHSKEYYALISGILSEADNGGKTAVQNALIQIRLKLLTGEVALNGAK